MPAFSSMRIAAYQGIGAMAPHSHEAPVLCLPLGGAYLERTRGRETEHRLGDILLCPSGEPHAQQFRAARVTKLLIHPTAETMDYLAGFVRVREAPYGRVRPLESLAVRLAEEIGNEDPQSALSPKAWGCRCWDCSPAPRSASAGFPAGCIRHGTMCG